jgi:hypothetical protein
MFFTKPSSPEKGISNEATLIKSQLLLETKVANDPYFSVGSNWNKVVVTFKTDEGGQTNDLVFDGTLSNPTGNFDPSSVARDVWEVQSVKIMDFDGGYLKLNRGDLTVEDFDIVLGAGGGSGLISYNVSALNLSFSSEFFYGVYTTEGNVIDSLSDGSIIFMSSSTGGQIKKFNPDGSKNETFEANFTGTINSTPSFIFVDSNDDIYSAVQNTEIIKFDSDGNEITSFSTNYGTYTGVVDGMIEMPDESLIIFGSSTLGYVKRINKDGTDFTGNSFNSNISGSFGSNGVTCGGLLSDNSIVLVGGMTYDDGVNSFDKHLVVLNDDGTLNLDKTNLYTNNGTYEVGSSTPKLRIVNDDLYVIGDYQSISGKSFGVILSDGNIDTDFQNNVPAISPYGGQIKDFVFADNGRIIVLGAFQNVGGNDDRDFFMALNSDGTLDSDFTVNNLDSLNTYTYNNNGAINGYYNSNTFFLNFDGEIDGTYTFLIAVSNT